MLPRRTPLDSLISFSESAQTIERLVRAQAPPYPSAYFELDGRKVLVHRVRILASNSHYEPAQVEGVTSSNNPIIKCGEGSVVLEDFEAPDNIRLFAGDVVSGRFS